MQLKLEKSRQTRVILVRHGESTYNALGLYQGSSDESVLTDVGRSDARKTGSFLEGLAFDAMYASSLKRAQETAREILGVMAPQVDQSEIFVTDKLRETDMPAWQGLAFQYVRENFPLKYRFWKQSPHEFWMNPISQLDSLFLGEEGLEQSSDLCIYPVLSLYQRVQEFWQEVLPHYVGKTLLLVTHGGTNRALISTALGITPDRYHCIQQSNCGISLLNFADGSLESGQLEVMNLSSHVGEYLPKPQEGGRGLRLLLVTLNTTVEETQNLAELLKEISIEFSLSSVPSNSDEIADKILQYHPETLQFEVLREDYLEEWQTVINAKSTLNPDKMTTGLVMAKEQTIKYLICQAIGMNLEQIERLQVKQGTISCIQYPGSHHPPILQAMNISIDQNKFIFQPLASDNLSFFSEKLT
ncbi:MAG: histidine phosphatase family protein [Cyanomargarita calcarea GSE-NOS-MK-12-04C]|uniref:Histidine phosphatase family protein n=1 Tax=Cyanomargarita calcarea GSE-NOS-MK-12-04C TaxID=2839659 RepID=A0A951QL81_9CYAN|nr:histidine phosphatase family protein [Cyanomargarita calcarea GSE-NOS-MK-12-04C]